MRELLFATVALLAAAVAGAAQGRVEVDEYAILAELRSGATAISIPVRNTAGHMISARLHLMWVTGKMSWYLRWIARSPSPMAPAASRVHSHCQPAPPATKST
jgi:hypothetical protein